MSTSARGYGDWYWQELEKEKLKSKKLRAQIKELKLIIKDLNDCIEENRRDYQQDIANLRDDIRRAEDGEETRGYYGRS